MDYNKEPWKIVVLEHDQSSTEIADFFEKIWKDGIIRKELTGEKLYDKNKITQKIKNVIGEEEGKILTLYGYGGFHHYTYGLCDAIARKRSKDYIYAHIDKHADDGDCNHKEDHLDCSAFVKRIETELGVKDIIYFGLNSKLSAKQGQTVIKGDLLILKKSKDIVEQTLREKSQTDIYPSFDLDVLEEPEINTSFDRGKLKLPNLLDIIDVMQQEKNIISADILGYVGVNAGKFVYNYIQSLIPPSLLTYATLAAKITGKDTKELLKLHDYFKTYQHPDIMNDINEFEKETEKLKV